jgi:hypothetical protein
MVSKYKKNLKYSIFWSERSKSVFDTGQKKEDKKKGFKVLPILFSSL